MADEIFERQCATEDMSTGNRARMRDLENNSRVQAHHSAASKLA